MALELLRNANIAAGRVLPGCQDTGTAIVMAHKGERVITGGDDAEALSRGVFDAYEQRNLRYSQLAPLDMYMEKNTGSNLPAQVEIHAEPGDEYELLFIAKGGGSANKTFLYQETKALLNPASLLAFVEAKLKTIGTSACPPYHLALVVGGTSAEFTMKTVKLASARYLDRLPSSGNERGRAFRDLDMERQVLEIAQKHRRGAPSSAASTSPTTRGSSGSRGTGRRARWVWASPARPTARRWRRSRARACSSSSSRRTRRSTSPTSPTASPGARWSASRSTGRCARSSRS